MAYTIPEYVDTQEQAILAVASAVKGEQVTGGDGSVNTALDILADALAGENVQVPMTQQGAILALAQYVDGMVKPEGTITITENGEGIDVAQYATADVSVSGGGVDVGPLGQCFSDTTAAPTVGGDATFEYPIQAVAVGGTTVFDGGENSYFGGFFAAGATLTTFTFPAEEIDTCDGYVCTIDGEFKYATVEQWDGTITRHDGTAIGDAPGYYWTFTMPELQEGETLVLYMHTAD